MMIDRSTFFDRYRAEFGRIRSRRQVASMETVLMLAETLPPAREDQLPYLLATVRHETADTWAPIREYGRGEGRAYGEAVRLDARRRRQYYGRGYVQLTWLANYATMSLRLEVDLVSDPDRALEPEVAWRVLTIGCGEGLFTGHRLGDFIGGAYADYVGARRVVNGTDRAVMIADYARQLERCLGAATARAARVLRA